MTEYPIRMGIVGFGKIAQDQHVPSIAGEPRYVLAAVSSSRNVELPGVPRFNGHHAMLSGMEGRLDAVALCMPPVARQVVALDCLQAGLHVLLEKPPALTLAEISELRASAMENGVVVFGTWHSRFNASVETAAGWLNGKPVRAVWIDWLEDVRKWHPGQEWIWEESGFGVFDPGINALSILTRLLPGQIDVIDAELFVPSNRSMPIAATLSLKSDDVEQAIAVKLDWRETREECWTIRIEMTDGDVVELRGGGSEFVVNGEVAARNENREYPGLYSHFADIVASGGSDLDARPLAIVLDAFARGRKTSVDAFES